MNTLPWKVQLKDDNDPHRDAAIKSYSVLPLTWDNRGRGGANISAVSSGGSDNTPGMLGARLTAFTGHYTLAHVVEPPSTNGSRVFRFDRSAALYYTTLYYITLRYTILHCATLYYTALYYITLRYTAGLISR